MDLAENLGPMAARRLQMRLDIDDARRARRVEREHAVRRLAETIAIFVSAPGAISISREKTATLRPSSPCAPSGAPVSTMTGETMLRPGPPKKRVRMVSFTGSNRLVATKAIPR